jgi:hypothetical protein
MAHYARNTPPVRPPERPQAPDQPWTGWWQPGAQDDQPPADPAGEHRDDTPTVTFEMPDLLAPVAAEVPDWDPGARGGLRRVGVEPSGGPIAAVDDSGAGPAEGHPDWAALESAATVAFAPAVTLLAEGEFSVEGVARRSGDLVFAGITFPHAVNRVPDPASIRLTVTESSNVDPDSIAIATLEGFGPDRVGFTFVAAALNPGAIWVDGHYHVEQ